MKLVVAIVQDYDTDRLLRAVTDVGLGATRIASTGGFLRTGNTTVLMGIDDGDLERCLSLVAASCGARIQRIADEYLADIGEWAAPGIDEVRIGGAVVLVARIARFERLPIQP